MGDNFPSAHPWQGERVRLRAIEPSDWQFHYEWNRSTDDCRLHEHLGFQCEGRLRRMEFTQGHYADHLLYGLTVEEWRAGLPASS